MLDPVLSEAIDFLERGDVITIFFDDLMGEARFGEKLPKWAVKSIAKRGIDVARRAPERARDDSRARNRLVQGLDKGR